MTDYNTLQKRRNVIVGAFVIIAAALLIWMIALFGDLPVMVTEFRSFKVVVQFPTAIGIQEQTPVRYCGFQVGRVTEVLPPMPVPNWQQGMQTHMVRIGLSIDNKYKAIPDNSIINVMKRSIGSGYVEIFDPEIPSGTFLREGMEYLRGGTATTNEFIPKDLQDDLEILVDRVKALAKSVDQVVGDKDNQINFKETLANFVEMSDQATKTLKSVEEFSAQNSESLHETAERISSAVKEFQFVLVKINDGEGTLGKLVNDGILYENLVESSEELRMALEQFKKAAAKTKEKGVKVTLF